MTVVAVLAFLVLVMLLGLVVWLVRQVMSMSARVLEIGETIIRPDQPAPPPPSHEPPVFRAAAQRLDPTDALIPDIDVSAGSTLAAAFPTVDPWLIGEPVFPETIAEVEFNPDDGPVQVMDADGNWVPLEEAQ